MPILYFVFIVIAVALIFDYFNGFHDAANSVATIVTTRVLTPGQAVLWAAFFNFVAAFLFGTGVAQTISNKLIDPRAVDVYVVCGGLIGAIAWDIITWLMALPTSSSHAIISGFAGAAIAKAGWHVILLKGWIPVLVFLVLSPVIGMVLGWSIMTAVSWLSRNSERYQAEKRFRHLQLLSAGLYSLGHGTNDAQKPWASSSLCSPPLATGSGAYPRPEASRDLRANTKSPGGSSSAATPPWPSEPSPVAGVSSKPSARASHRTCAPSAASQPKWQPQPPSVSPPSPRSPSPPPTLSAEPSPA